jgi:hypothetical protein
MENWKDNIEAHVVVRHTQQPVGNDHLNRPALGPEWSERRISEEPISTPIDAYRNHAMAALNESFVDRHS